MKMVELVYLTARKFPREEIYGLTAQLKRAAISVPANIAEGNARASRKDYAHFLSIARGSLTEAETLLLLAKQLHYVSSEEIEPVMKQIDGISRMLKTMRSRILAPEAK